MKSQAGEAERTGVKSDHEEAIPFPILVGTPSQSLGPVSEETGPSAVQGSESIQRHGRWADTSPVDPTKPQPCPKCGSEEMTSELRLMDGCWVRQPVCRACREARRENPRLPLTGRIRP